MPLTRLLRFLWALTQRVFVWGLIAFVLVCAFFIAMNASNIFISLKDAMQTRVAVAMHRTDEASMTKYFTPEFIAWDTAYRDGRYDASNVRGFDHWLRFHMIWAWPWETTAVAEVTEIVRSIDGEVYAAYLTEEQRMSGEKVPPPEWPAAKYRIVLSQQEGRWLVAALEKIEDAPQPTPLPSQTPSGP